jgi:hypothetical protein
VQDRPDPSTVLDAISQFLTTEVLPKIGDKALAFRVMIAANLTTTLSSELRTEDARWQSEFSRLQRLVPGIADGTLPARRAEKLDMVQRLNRALTAKLREGTLSTDALEQVRKHLEETALETLAVVNPRFDTAAEID